MNGNDDLAKTLNEGLQFEETPMPGAPAGDPTPPTPPVPPVAPDEPEEDDMRMPSLDPDAGDPDKEPMMSPPTMGPTPPMPDEPKDKPAPAIVHPHKPNHKDDDKPTVPKAAAGDLDGLKASALEELRPLVGKLKLPAKERFDTLLLIIRSTDDQSLLGQAHDAAKEIEDDTQRAEALLDVIKEIDYFSSKR
jgi:hypothetical protein